MNEVLSYVLFKLGPQAFTVGQLILTIILLAVIFFVYRMILKRYSPKAFEDTSVTKKETNRLLRLIRATAILFFILGIVIVMKLDTDLFKIGDFSISILLILKAAIFFQVARLLDWLISNLIIHHFYVRRDQGDERGKNKVVQTENSAKKTVQYIFYTLIGIYLITNFNLDVTLLEKSIDGKDFNFKLTNILSAVLIVLIAQLIVWVCTQLILYNIYKRKEIEQGSQYAINQLITYVIYIFAFVFALQTLGINMSLLLGGAAALLVGIGLGLQQTFNDLISGVVLLFERSVAVGDILEIEGEVGTIKKIGLRASTLSTRGNVNIIVPNHLLINEKVINWNDRDDKVRFKIDIGVAYGTDTVLVKKLLIKSVAENPYVLNLPAPFVRFNAFGSSSLDFSLFFFSRNLLIIEDVKSDIRLEIDRIFRENKIQIPFPQTDVWIRNEGS